MQIGRGLDCQIVVADPLLSRVHATLSRDEERCWWLRDTGSRNGTYVNGQKIDEAQLMEGCVFRVGSSEFEFHIQERPSDATSGQDLVQTIVGDARVDDSGAFPIEALRDEKQAQDFLMLYQLSIKLLGCREPDQVIQIGLDLLRERTRASVAGFLSVNDEGVVQAKQVIPDEARDKVTLSGSLTDMVFRERRAVWIKQQSAASASQSLSHYADAICIPLIREKSKLGAIHLYLERGHFEAQDFEFSKSVANILSVALLRAWRQASLEADHERLVHQSASFVELVGDSKPMLDLKSKIARVARAPGCVLVRGESGVGKELVARAIHKASPRAERPLLAVNCAAIPRDLMESQLFGHRKGAFTGADADHAGWFQQADSGTLFLDEVGELTLEGQAKLLRILEGHPFLTVGGTKEIRVDVRVIGATNRDLREFVRERRFREDLYYRLTVFELYVPPLRERSEDIETLVRFFLDHFTRQHGRPKLGLSGPARQMLLGYQWPGNVRQLRNVIDSAVVMAEGAEILPEDLGLRDARSDGELETLRIDHWERKLIQEALKRTGGKVPEAANLLGLGRATLYRKIEDYGISR